MTLETLLLLQHILRSQQLTVGDPQFVESAHKALAAIVELDAAIAVALEIPAEASRTRE